MNRQLSVFLALVASMLATIWAECPNACSAHGKCGAYDMCTCYRNWMAADCSESKLLPSYSVLPYHLFFFFP
jgi:hypothetical protein